MSTYIISDTHFNHRAMETICGRPADFEEKIFNNLMGHLSDTTKLIHLGDICLKSDKLMHEKYIKPLPGIKILVRGNHDRKSNTWYLNHGRDFVCESITDNLYGMHLRFTHIPRPTQSSDTLNIHGHWHDKHHGDSIPDYNGLLYSPENMDYKPIKLDKFLHINGYI